MAFLYSHLYSHQGEHFDRCRIATAVDETVEIPLDQGLQSRNPVIFGTMPVMKAYTHVLPQFKYVQWYTNRVFSSSLKCVLKYSACVYNTHQDQYFQKETRVITQKFNLFLPKEIFARKRSITRHYYCVTR